MFLNAGILAVGLVVYIFVARAFTERPILSSEKVRQGRKGTGGACPHTQRSVDGFHKTQQGQTVLADGSSELC
jgi:hypothetical protein